MKNINLEWLRTFNIFASASNITEAANELGISQPAVTLHLKNLEGQFDLPLFQTIGRKKELTAFGKEIHKLIQHSLGELERQMEHLKLLHGNPETSTIRMGGRREILEKILLNQSSSNTHLQAMESDTESAIAMLKTLDLDIAFTHYRPLSADLVAKPLFKENAKLIVHPRLLKHKNSDLCLDKNFLLQTPVLFYKNEPPYLKELFHHLNLPLQALHPQVIIDNWNVIISLVEKGRGYSIVPSSFPLGKEVLSFDLPKKIAPSIEIYAVFHTSARKSKVLSEFLKGL